MRIRWLAPWLVLILGCTQVNPSFQTDLGPQPDQQAADVQGADLALVPDALQPYDRHSDAEPASDLAPPDLAPSTVDLPVPAGPDLGLPDGPWMPDLDLDGASPDVDPCAGVVCSAPHASGYCAEGQCQYQCDIGWGDCNGSTSDGCEVDLTSDPLHCGGCASPCPAVPNASIGCVGGSCAPGCIAPYADCNNDPSDGCEIPVGVPDSCGPGGLSTFSASAGATPGCGTAYCGSGGQGAVSFGSWYCSFCAHCEKFSDGYAWCIPATGLYSAQRCTKCCKPNDPTFPAVCQP